MIVYGATEHFGLPDPSPFVVKLYTLLKMADIRYETRLMDFKGAPKGKIPYIELDGKLIGDSTLIKFILEDRFKADFTGGYSNAQLAFGWSIEKMCEEHLYWGILYDRWMNDYNFDRGPRVFFEDAPAILRPFIINSVRKKVKQNLFGAGMGRHTYDEISMLCNKDIDAISEILGDKNFILGNEPCGYDAGIHAILWGLSLEMFYSKIGEHLRTKPNLMNYIKRMSQLYYAG